MNAKKISLNICKLPKPAKIAQINFARYSLFSTGNAFSTYNTANQITASLRILVFLNIKINFKNHQFSFKNVKNFSIFDNFIIQFKNGVS